MKEARHQKDTHILIQFKVQNPRPGIQVHACNPSYYYSGGKDRRITVAGQPR
jgi:hypothetical protein